MWEKILQRFSQQTESDSLLAEFEDTLMLIVDPEQLTNNLLSKLRELTSVEKAFVYLADRSESARAFLAVDTVSREAYKLPELAIDGRIAQWFRTNRQILFFEDNREVTRYLATELEPFLGASANLALPLISMDRLIGIVFVHLLEGPLNKVQLANLQVLSRQAGLAFENALLFKERLRQNERMFRAEQLATMGQFAAGIAHELRNPLTAIRSTVQYLAGEFEKGTDQRKLADDTLEEVDRLNTIVGNLLSLAQPAESNPEEIDVAEQIDRCLGLIEAKAKSQNVTLQPDFASDLPWLTFDPAQLRQLLVNVLMNGLQAMPEGGTLLIRAGSAGEAGRTSGPDSRRMLIEVTDEGEGIVPELRQRVFEPFFTTKPGGTGLGLAICNSIVKRYNGEIWIEQAESGGAAVRISLPVK